MAGVETVWLDRGGQKFEVVVGSPEYKRLIKDEGAVVVVEDKKEAGESLDTLVVTPAPEHQTGERKTEEILIPKVDDKGKDMTPAKLKRDPKALESEPSPDGGLMGPSPVDGEPDKAG